jgi:hypothetical protein
MTIEKILKGSIALVAVFILSYVVYQRITPESGVDSKGKLEQLPKFKFPKAGGTGNISKSDLRWGKTVVLYFSPDCEHCQALGADIGRQLGQLKDIDFVFVSRFDEAKHLFWVRCGRCLLRLFWRNVYSFSLHLQ